jgi:hypothetical protein
MEECCKIYNSGICEKIVFNKARRPGGKRCLPLNPGISFPTLLRCLDSGNGFQSDLKYAKHCLHSGASK